MYHNNNNNSLFLYSANYNQVSKRFGKERPERSEYMRNEIVSGIEHKSMQKYLNRKPCVLDTVSIRIV